MRQVLKRMPFLRDPAVRRVLKQLPVVRQFRRAARRARRAYYRHFGRSWLTRRLAASPSRRIVIGAWSRFDPGWIPTQREFLNLLEPRHWERCFQPDSVDAMLAEHVWEHLSEAEGLAAARTCYRYLKPGGYLRVAVPDGLLPDPAYVALVRPAPPSTRSPYGPDGNSENHKALYTYRTLQQLFERAGFRVFLYEYFDETGHFHCRDWDARGGTIWRSKRFDPRNRRAPLASVHPGTLEDYLSYSSIILDAFKEPGPARREEAPGERRSSPLPAFCVALAYLSPGCELPRAIGVVAEWLKAPVC